MPPVPEQLRVVRGDHERLTPVLLLQRTQPRHHGVDEVLDVQPQHVRGQRRVVRRLVRRLDRLAGDARRLEPDLVRPGVEVAVCRVAGVAGLRRPDAVGDLEVSSESDHVAVADRPRRPGLAAQRRPVDHEPPDARGRVVLFHTRRVAALRRPNPGGPRPDPQRRVGQAGVQCELAHPRVQQRLERVGQRPAEQLDRRIVDQRTKDGGEAVPPAGAQLLGRADGGPVLGRRQLPQGRVASPQRRRVLGAQLPVAEPVVERADAVRVVELRGEHRRDAQRQQILTAFGGEPLEQVDHRQVGVRPRLVEPFLADGPAPVVRQPRQVAVQDEAEGAFVHRRTATATRSRLASRSSPWMSKPVASMAATSASSASGQTA